MKKIFKRICILLFLIFPINSFATKYEAIDNFNLAEKFQPTIWCDTENKPIAMYYRMAKINDQELFIAYHIVWAYEKNPNKGCKPFINRSCYTGGLKLQKKIFGKGDIEVIAVKINIKDNKISDLWFETAKDYNPKDFSVKHKEIHLISDEISELNFTVCSWNNLFCYQPNTKKIKIDFQICEIPLAYFSKDLWDNYKMQKEKESFFSRNRAFYEWEKQSIK